MKNSTYQKTRLKYFIGHIISMTNEVGYLKGSFKSFTKKIEPPYKTVLCKALQNLGLIEKISNGYILSYILYQNKNSDTLMNQILDECKRVTTKKKKSIVTNLHWDVGIDNSNFQSLSYEDLKRKLKEQFVLKTPLFEVKSWKTMTLTNSIIIVGEYEFSGDITIKKI